MVHLFFRTRMQECNLFRSVSKLAFSFRSVLSKCAHASSVRHRLGRSPQAYINIIYFIKISFRRMEPVLPFEKGNDCCMAHCPVTHVTHTAYCYYYGHGPTGVPRVRCHYSLRTEFRTRLVHGEVCEHESLFRTVCRINHSKCDRFGTFHPSNVILVVRDSIFWHHLTISKATPATQPSALNEENLH